MQTVAQLVSLPLFSDERGLLSYGEIGEHLPFTPVRFFATTHVPRSTIRGRHAHRTCEQLLIVLQGSCRILLLDGSGSDVVTLDSPTVGLHIPPEVWVEQSDTAPGTVVLVLASEKYEPDDYIRSLDEFREIVGGT